MFCLEAVFKVLETSKEGNLLEANRSLGQALPLLGASLDDTSQLPMAKSGILQKWVLWRTQMCRNVFSGLLSLPCLHTSPDGMLTSCPTSP